MRFTLSVAKISTFPITSKLLDKNLRTKDFRLFLLSFVFLFVILQRKQKDDIMGKLMFFLYFILSVFPADATENRRHIHVVRRGSKNSHRGNTVAKIWIEENGLKKIDIAWSELNADEESEIIKVIDENWEELNKLIDQVFAGKKIQIKRIK